MAFIGRILYNVWYGDPKCTATRNNRLFARNDTTNNLLFRVAVYFGTPYATLQGRFSSALVGIPLLNRNNAFSSISNP